MCSLPRARSQADNLGLLRGILRLSFYPTRVPVGLLGVGPAPCPRWSRLALRMEKPRHTPPEGIQHPRPQRVLPTFIQNPSIIPTLGPLQAPRASSSLWLASHFYSNPPSFPPLRYSRENVLCEMQVWFCHSSAGKAFF